MKSWILIFLIIISTSSFGFCQTEANYKYQINRINTILNSANDKIIISEIDFLFGYSPSQKKGVFILSIEEIKKKTQSNKFINREYLLNSEQIEKLNILLNQTDLKNFVTDSLITGYNFNWVDCPSTSIYWNGKDFNYKCLSQQNISEAQAPKNLVKNILDIIEYGSVRRVFINSLPKGKFQTGMVLITIR